MRQIKNEAVAAEGKGRGGKASKQNKIHEFCNFLRANASLCCCAHKTKGPSELSSECAARSNRQPVRREWKGKEGEGETEEPSVESVRRHFVFVLFCFLFVNPKKLTDAVRRVKMKSSELLVEKSLHSLFGNSRVS